MNYKTGRFGKVKRRFGFSLLLISIIVVFNFGLLSAGGEGDAEILAFNTSEEGLAPPRKSTLAGHGLPDREFHAASGFKLEEGFPKPRIFTPNNDNENDIVIFKYKNDDESSIVCWIYDIKGSVVKQPDIDPLKNEFTWDGTNENNDVAPSGIYIYQIEVKGQTINGTIVLAK